MSSKWNNRLHPIIAGQDCTTALQLDITTHCSMECPNCCISIPQFKADKTAKHCSVEEIVRDSVYLQDLRRIHLSGGEPTIHPQFKEIVTNAKEWFKPKYLSIETNGVFYKRYREQFQLFDLVFITHYIKDYIYPGNPDNTEIIEMAEKDLGDRLIREPPVEHMAAHDRVYIQLGDKEEPCSKFRITGLPGAWYSGRLYKCAVTIGIDPSLYIPVTADWKEKIVKLPMGCQSCAFRGT